MVVPTDIDKEEDCKNLIQQSLEKYGRIDILVNNAGISMRAQFQDTQLDVIERLMQVNFWGSVYCTKYALSYLLDSKGSIVVISTTAGFVGLPGRTGYSASKFALHGFFDTLRSEHAKDGLHVAMIFPGFVASNIRKTALRADGSMQEESPRDEAKMRPPSDVANAVLKAVQKRKRQVLIGAQAKLVWWLKMLFPAWLEKQIGKHMRSEKDAPFNN